MTSRKLILIVVAFCFGCQKTQDTLRPEDIAVQTEVRHLIDALYGGDIDTVLQFMHPKIIKQMGGESQAQSVLRGRVADFRSSDLKVLSVTFPEPPTYEHGQALEFVIVPVKIGFVVTGQRIDSLNYHFGARQTGEKQWKYIEGSRINARNVKTLFPDFPANYKFPEISSNKS